MDVADTLTPMERSAVMARIRGKGTKPEMLVRRMVHGMGFRYRLHRRDLPGTPDLVFPRLSKVIFVHGCFWHRHQAAGCGRARLPKSRVAFWVDKLEGNRARDAANLRRLRADGWKVLQLWECQLNDPEKVERRLRRFLA